MMLRMVMRRRMMLRMMMARGRREQY